MAGSTAAAEPTLPPAPVPVPVTATQAVPAAPAAVGTTQAVPAAPAAVGTTPSVSAGPVGTTVLVEVNRAEAWTETHRFAFLGGLAN